MPEVGRGSGVPKSLEMPQLPRIGRRWARLGIVLAFLVLVWLVVGCFAALQNGYFSGAGCDTAVDTALMVVEGPLSYQGPEYLPGACSLPD